MCGYQIKTKKHLIFRHITITKGCHMHIYNTVASRAVIVEVRCECSHEGEYPEWFRQALRKS